MKNNNSNFKKAYNDVSNSMGSIEASRAADQYVSKVNEEINITVNLMKELGRNNKDINYSKGDIAEAFHGGTLGIDGVAKNILDQKITIPRDTSPVDIEARNSFNIIKAQIKYYKTPLDTAKAISNPKYEALYKIVPEDQLEGVKQEAYKLYLKNINNRPEQAKQYYHTFKNVSDRLKLGDANSKPISNSEMLKIANEIKKNKFSPEGHGLNSESFIKWSDIFRESQQAALNAALISAVLKSYPYLVEYIKEFINGNDISYEKLKSSGLDILYNSTTGAIRGGITASIVSSCKAGLLGSELKNLSPNIVAGAVVVAMNSIYNSVLVYKGEMTKEEFAYFCLRDSFVVSMGISGSAIGQIFIPIPILGALIGNLIGSLCGVIMFEGSKNVFFSFFINSGISFFSIVKQDYKLPTEVLKQCGLELIELDKIELDKIELDIIELDKIELELMDIKYLKRGMISINTVGYIN